MTAPTVVGTATRTLISQPASAMAVGLSMLVDGDELAIVHRDVSDDLVVFGFQTGTARAYRLDELVQMVVIRQPCPRWCVDCSTDSDGVTRHGGQVVTLADGAEIQAVAYADPDGSVEPTTIVVAHPDGECAEMPLRAALYLGAALRATAEAVLRGGQR